MRPPTKRSPTGRRSGWAILAGVLVGPFVLTELIGSGAMGEVWSAHHATDGVPVAVKVITSARARSEAARRAFAREVQAMARLRHPNVLMLLDAGEVSVDAAIASADRLTPQSPYLVMERAHATLDERVDRVGDFESLRALLLELLDALAHAHARGVVHRDIKPLNVLVVDDDDGPSRFKLADFGVAHAFRDPRAARGEKRAGASGTPRYMAPEQVVGAIRDQGPWTDLYSLGCVAYWLAAGQTPFSGNLAQVFRAHLEADLPSLAPRFAVAEGFEGWLKQLLEKRPSDRFRRAADAAHELMLLEPPPPDAVAPTPVPKRTADEETTVVFALAEWDARPTDVPRSMRANRAPMSRSWRRPEPRPSPRLLGAGLGLYALRPVALVGREAERDHLWSRLAEIHGGSRVGAVVVRGPSGVGKSRLVEWFAERAHELGAAELLEANHGPIAGPNDGVVAAIRRHSHTAGLDREARMERLYTQLSDDGRRAEVDGIALRVLAEIIGRGEVPVRAEDRMHAEARYLASIARERPVVLWIDDAQWAPDALALCERMLGDRTMQNEARVLIVLTVRDDALAERPLEARRLAAIASHSATTSVALRSLAAQDHAALVDRLMGLSSELAHTVTERTAGNPLFAVQLVGDWVERGVLEVGEGGFRLVPGESAPLPDGMHAVWSDRVDRVLAKLEDPTQGRVALEIAATLGHVLDERQWRAVCRRCDIEPPARLGRTLQRARLAWPRHGAHEHGWGFAHGMLRESLMRSADEAGRLVGHHRACAEELAADERREGDHGERIAEHLLGAGDVVAALPLLLMAAELHSRRGDFDRSLALDDRRDALVDELGLGLSDPRRLLGLCRRIRTQCIRGDYDTARARLEMVVSAADGVDDLTTLAELRWTQAVFARHDNDPASGERWLGEALERFEALGDATGVARCHKKLGEMLRIAGKLDAAAEHYATARGAFEALGDAFEIAWSAMGLCSTERQRGDLDAAARWARVGLEGFEATGGHLGIGHANNELGEIARFAGDFERACEHYDVVLEVWGDQPHRDLDLIRFNLALGKLGMGDVDEARARLEEVRERARKGGRRGLLLYVTAGLCEVAATGGDWAACEASLLAVSPMFEEVPLVDIDLARSMERAGQLAAAAGRGALARGLLARAVSQHRALGDEAAAGRLEGLAG